jgi:tetratricopeptide (TPR) repeat protein
MNQKITGIVLFLFIVQFLPLSSKASDSCTLLVSEARKLMQNANYKTAIILLDRCLKMDQTNATAYNLRGCATIFQSYVNDEKNNKTAIIFFSKALQYDGANFFYLNNRGWAYQNLDDYLNSSLDFRKAVELDSNNVELHCNVLRNLWIRNRYKEAYAYCDKLINKFPNDGYAWYVRGQLKRDYLHKYPEGNKDIKKSEALGWKKGFDLMY